MSTVHENLTCELMLTSACNMRCTYCIARGLAVATMGVELGQKAIDMFVSMSTGAKVLEFIFTGGEPLLDFHSLKHLTRYAKETANSAGMDVSFVLKTNGLLLNKEIEVFIEVSNVRVVMSIDGNAEVHNKYRKSLKQEGTHHIVVKNLKTLLQREIPCVASYTIHPNEARTVLANVQYLYELGASKIDVGPAYGTVDWNNQSISDLIYSLQDVAKYMRSVRKLGGSLEVGPLYLESEHVMDSLADHWGCGAGINKLAFLPNGQIAGCSSLAMMTDNFPNLIIGEVNAGLDELALDGLQQQSQAPVENRYSCQKCKTASNCAGGCLAINYAVSGKPLLPPPFYCKTIDSISKAWTFAWGPEAPNSIN